MTWVAVVAALEKAWTWLKQNTHFVLLCLIGYFTGAALLRRKDSQISTLKEGLAAEKHKSEIERLKGKAEILAKLDIASEARDQALVDQQTAIEQSIAAHKKRLLALHEKQLDVNRMTDAEVEEHFRNAGL